MTRVLFVCLGNICRSPTAEGVMRHLAEREGLAKDFDVDSAGTAAHHVGERPDARATRAARRRGIVLDHRARQVVAHDLERFDLVLAMDSENLRALSRLRVEGARARVALLRDFDPASPRGASVPDPYYGGDPGFDEVLDLCFAACAGLMASVRAGS